MSATSKHGLYTKQESAYGVWTNGYGNGTLLEVRHTSWDVGEDISYTQSNEITASREPLDQLKTDSRVRGSLGFELSYETTLIRLLTAALLNDSSATIAYEETDTTYGLSQVTNALTSSDAGLHLNLQAVSGSWLRIGGFSTNSDNIIAKAAELTISGTFTALTGSLTARSGVTEGDAVVGATSGATGYLVAIDSGAPKTYTIKVTAGVFQAGETVQKSGSAGNNISVIVISTAAAVLSGVKVATESAGADITVRKVSRAFPGSTTRSYSFESVQSDLSGVFEIFLGCMFTSLNVTVPPKGAITGSFGIKGAEKALRTATAGGGTITSAAGNPSMQCETNFYGCLMGPAEGTLTALTDTDNSATTVCTTALPHGLQTGDLIVLHGNADSDNNRNWLVTYVDDYNFSLQGSSAQTAQTGSNAGYFRKLKVAKAIEAGSFSIDNQLRETTQAGVSGIVSQPIGTLTLTGSLDIYFDSITEQRRYKNDEYTGVAFVFQETADPTHIYVFEFPRIKYTQAPAPITGNNDERRNRVQWAASKDPTEGRSLIFCY